MKEQFEFPVIGLLAGNFLTNTLNTSGNVDEGDVGEGGYEE